MVFLRRRDMPTSLVGPLLSRSPPVSHSRATRTRPIRPKGDKGPYPEKNVFVFPRDAEHVTLGDDDATNINVTFRL
ncbi:hypothetical protein FRACA_140010 [Frankia canadensis]|uniref:Uncharacterized protein n=1 Tax=Frankia canadensis TaxID=1836972 RepID=A0A2I2KL60_9ACTN|nr:hypothetical protein FRACA_140010 [Frankia canadensis]SOU53701.1 hypothetical protein FRACA_140010 [Frankia canadensis]